MNTAILDRRFDEDFIAATWKLFFKHGFTPSTDPGAVSLAVYWLHLTTIAFEGRAETI